MHEQRFAAIAVALAATGFLVAMGAAVVILGWLGVSVYAIIKLVGSAPEEPNAVAVVLLFVGIVTVLTALLGGAIALVGRSMTPKRRSSDADHRQVADGMEDVG